MFVNTPCFGFINFSYTVDKLMVRYTNIILVTPCCEIREGILAKIWSIKDVFLQVIRAGDFITCFNLNIAQN